MKFATDLGQILLFGKIMFFDKCDNRLSNTEVEGRTDTKLTTLWSIGPTYFAKK
jgi:hypothetical protein